MCPNTGLTAGQRFGLTVHAHDVVRLSRSVITLLPPFFEHACPLRDVDESSDDVIAEYCMCQQYVGLLKSTMNQGFTELRQAVGVQREARD